LQNWKRQRAIEYTQQRVEVAKVTEANELGEQIFFTTMAPPKQGELIHITKQPRYRTIAQTQSQESEQQPFQPPKVVNVDEIPLLDTTIASPLRIEEETQQT
jgi:hypothetical protein